MSRHLKGCYIDLLIAQFNNGPLSFDTIKTVLGQDQANWTVLSNKFKQTAEGLWYNERLAAEVEKRQKFSESRRNNASKRYNKDASADASDSHTHLRMENRNRDSLAVLGKDYSTSKDRQEFLTNQRWKEEFCMSKGLSLQELEERQAEWLKDVDLSGKPIDSYKAYFLNCYNKNPLERLVKPMIR